jgi:hypothetical protein
MQQLLNQLEEDIELKFAVEKSSVGIVAIVMPAKADCSRD